MSAYADGIIVFLKSQSNMAKLCESVTSFNNLSSAKVSWHKSEALAVSEEL